MNFPKIVIISNGKHAAALLNGVMVGDGVSAIQFKSDGITSTLDITGIDCDRIELGSEADFLETWKRFSDELSNECEPFSDSVGGQVFHEDDTSVG